MSKGDEEIEVVKSSASASVSEDVEKDEGDEVDDGSIEDIVVDDARGNVPVIPRVSEFVVPSLERDSIVERGLESGVRRVAVESDFEDNDVNAQYGEMDDYESAGGGDYESRGGGKYESGSSIEIDSQRAVGGSDSGVPSRGDVMSGGGYPGGGKKDKKYHSPLEQGSMDEDKKKREKERKSW
jgi:hypothetical protein